MAHTISDGSTTVTPYHVTPVRYTRPSGNILHEVPGREDPDVVMRAAGSRQGTLEVVCTGWGQATQVEAMHAAAGALLNWANPDTPALSMSYVLAGPLDVAQGTGSRVVVQVPFRAVTP